jgi:hypothetical protein
VEPAGDVGHDVVDVALVDGAVTEGMGTATVAHLDGAPGRPAKEARPCTDLGPPAGAEDDPLDK